MFLSRFPKPDVDIIGQFQHIYASVLQGRSAPEHKPRCRNEGTLHPVVVTKYANNDCSITQPPVPISWDTTKPKNEGKYSEECTRHDSEMWDFSSPTTCPSSLDMVTVDGQCPGEYPSIHGTTETIPHENSGNIGTPMLEMDITSPPSLPAPFTVSQQEVHGPQLASQQKLDARRLNQTQQNMITSCVITHNSDLDVGAINRSINEVQVGFASGMTSSANLARQRELPHSYSKKFRYNIHLCAPTAMVEHAEEIPVTYLNKGQRYTLSITDSNPPSLNSESAEYRTYVRISFDGEEQRCNPTACWQLWKEGRGSNQVSRRAEGALAVEYDDTFHKSNKDFQNRVRVERTMVDSFCVIWTANPASGAPPSCTIPLRFNFVSTDFQRCKGVKGLPVRLGVKTQILMPDVDACKSLTSEMCYCKVKLFRDHGAERRMSHDVVYVKKTIAKLEQQLAHIGMGSGCSRRKRRRTWSRGLPRGLLCESRPGDDLRAEIIVLESMFLSTHPVSVLGLRSDEADDPDLYPVYFPGDIDLKGFKTEGTSGEITADMPFTTALDIFSSNNSVALAAFRPHPNTHMSNKGIMAIDYIAGCSVEAIACLYVKFYGTESQRKAYYRAIYLTERTEPGLVHKFAEKLRIDPAQIVRVLHVNKKGLQIMVDDDFVRELPEGQNMVAEVHVSHSPSHSNAVTGRSSMAVEIRLIY